MRARILAVVCCLTLVPPALCPAQTVGPITFTEPELPLATVVDGLATSTIGGNPVPLLSFGFSVGGNPSTACVISDIGPVPGADFYDRTLIIGPTGGLLHIDFGAEVTRVAFGIGLLSQDEVTDACTAVAVTGDGTVVGSVTVDAPEDLPFSEALVILDPPGRFRGVRISFSSEPSDFGLDNLEYDLVPPPVPALSSWMLAALAAALAAAALAALRRSSA